jgi:hypothetical protein
MNYASNLLNNKCELILAVIFIVFLISKNDDKKLAVFVDKPEVKIYVIVVALSLFFFCNKLVGILAIFVAYDLLTLSHTLINTPILSTPRFSLFENKSIEEEIIHKMIPHCGGENYDCLFKPFDNLWFNL